MARPIVKLPHGKIQRQERSVAEQPADFLFTFHPRRNTLPREFVVFAVRIFMPDHVG